MSKDMRKYNTICLFFINPQTLEKWALQPLVDKFPTALGSCQPRFLIRCACQKKKKRVRTKGEKGMNLAEKIIMLRKQKGWSQEGLAEQLDISRHGPVIIGLN